MGRYAVENPDSPLSDVTVIEFAEWYAALFAAEKLEESAKRLEASQIL
jgi:crotonobetainyl-CoA:carnitine CoA-transferase CaiB-like acyl-CoA transferase